MRTHEPCQEHQSKADHRMEGVPYCMECEVNALRDLLRQVANSFAFKEEACEPAAVMVRLKADLWQKIQPLHNGVK